MARPQLASRPTPNHRHRHRAPPQLRPGTVINCGVMAFNVRAWAAALPSLLDYADAVNWEVGGQRWLWGCSCSWLGAGLQLGGWGPGGAKGERGDGPAQPSGAPPGCG